MDTGGEKTKGKFTIRKCFRIRFGVASLLGLVTAFLGVIGLVRTRFDLERRYEAQIDQKVSTLLSIRGLRVQSRVDLDNFFRIRWAATSIHVPAKYVRTIAKSRNGDLSPDSVKQMEIETIYRIESAVSKILPPPPHEGDDPYRQVRVIVFDEPDSPPFESDVQ